VTITPQRLTQKLALRDQFLNILTAAQGERPAREYVTDGELGWVIYERETMHRAVNEARAERGLAPVPLAAVERVESLASGHSDYSSKFALYCAELALQEQP
jgi:phosphopantetheine adenylyltransferase